MKKNLFITFGIAIALLIYGYLASSAGHDHSRHSHGNTQVKEEHTDHGHGDHDQQEHHH